PCHVAFCHYELFTMATTFETKTVYVGENINLTCPLHWYKQSVGDTLKLIVTLFETATPQYGQEIFKSRFQTHYDKKFSNLTILKAVQDDEGIYHCGMIEWINPEWTGTYLLVKGKLVIHCHTFIHFKVAGSDQLHPSIIYTDGNRHSESEIISDSQERCLYRFSKNVSSSDAGTYYCAVATCGEILFGNGTKLDIEGI
uniref:Immunoglobulin domain-containing protein n=1 Tax=Oreochromis niloticus TaxID=8128 RepID=I3KV89_ORENI